MTENQERSKKAVNRNKPTVDPDNAIVRYYRL